jgi:hypothetical protein
MQEPLYDLPIFILLYILLLLIGLTAVLFIFSLIIRSVNLRNEKREAELKEKYYPIIFEFLEEEVEEKKDRILSRIGNSTFDYYVLEMILKELIDQIEGEDDQKLRELLFMEPIYRRHLKQLKSGKDTEKLKACLYFSYARRVNPELINTLRTLLDHPNRFLAFSAASALMASDNTNVRAQAIEHISRVHSISEMGLLELLYKFQNENSNQRDLEAFYLIQLIRNPDIDTDNRALIIEGASEMHYVALMNFLRRALESNEELWQPDRVKVALIRAQRNMLDEKLRPLLLKYLESDDLEVQIAAADLLNKYHDPKLNREVLRQIQGKDEYRDFSLLKTYCEEYRDEQEMVISNLQHLDAEYVIKLIQMVQPELVLTDGH